MQASPDAMLLSLKPLQVAFVAVTPVLQDYGTTKSKGIKPLQTQTESDQASQPAWQVPAGTGHS